MITKRYITKNKYPALKLVLTNFTIINNYKLLNKWQCVCLCLSVLCRNPNSSMNLDEIRHKFDEMCKEGKEWLRSLSRAFWQNFIKQKLQGTPLIKC